MNLLLLIIQRFIISPIINFDNTITDDDIVPKVPTTALEADSNSNSIPDTPTNITQTNSTENSNSSQISNSQTSQSQANQSHKRQPTWRWRVCKFNHQRPAFRFEGRGARFNQRLSWSWW